MLDVYAKTAPPPRSPPVAKRRLTACAACGEPCLRDADALVGFCDDCLESVDPKTYAGYPDGWVTLGGGD